MTRPGSPSMDGDRLEVRRAVGKIATASRACSSAQPVAGHHRPRPHPLGHPRAPVRGQRAPARGLHRARWWSSTTGSSRTTSSSRRRLEAEGHRFRSETDTEVMAHLIERYLASGAEPGRRRSRPRSASVRGAYAFGVLSADAPGRLIVAKRGAGAWSSGSATARSSSPPTSRRCCPTRATWSSWRTARWRWSTARRAVALHARRTAGGAGAHAHHLGRGDGREGRLPALHAEGDPRAAARRWPTPSGARALRRAAR